MVKKADESIFIDFESIDGEIEEGYRAFCYLLDEKGEKIKDKELERSNDNRAFLLRIYSGELEVGRFRLQVAVINNEIGYKDYIFDEELIVKE